MKLLKIGEKTVKVHRGRMMEKLGVRTVADLVRMADKAGIQRSPYSYEPPDVLDHRPMDDCSPQPP